jgi:exodeoxyribonuclease V gamma subunit
MLKLHFSNQLENLGEQFAKLVSSPLDSVFAEEQIIIPNAGMQRWLCLQMAQQLGICANYHFFSPEEYMWKLLRQIVANIPQKDPSQPEILRWRLASLFLDKIEHYPELAHYLNDDEMAAWDLADALAPVLDQYLFYRPDWIRLWESGQFAADDWQARLWRQLMKPSGEVQQVNHWLDLQDHFIDTFAAKITENPLQTLIGLPQRVCFFSVPALSPGYTSLLAELATHIDVHLFMVNPCYQYWGDSETKKQQLPHPSVNKSNALLDSLGKQGREYLDQLYQLGTQTETEWIDPQRDSLLHCLQSDVLSLQQSHLDVETLDEEQSIQFHSCHTPMREVEVLHDQILAALETSADLTLADIVVMTPTIERYAPYIEAVFSTAEQALPFSIADRSSASHKPEVEVFLKLLDLPEQRFNVEAVFELLEYEVIRRQFDLTEKQVIQCRHWAEQTNIRWGVSAELRVAMGLANSNEHSWKQGLDRMLLGYMMPGKQLFSDTLLLPFNDIEGQDALVLSFFCRFTDSLFQLADWSLLKLNVNEWIENLTALVTTIFSSKVAYQTLITALDRIDQQQQLAEFKRPVTFSIIKKIVQDLLEVADEARFMSHGITFCALLPMRSVPFKMVALLGMNEGEFPRQDPHHSFDKMALEVRKGDRSNRNEDRYVFLESLLAARQRLYISYVGQSVQDNGSLPPSVVVSELLDYLTEMTGCRQEKWICKHPLQAFSRRYYIPDKGLFSYVKEYLSLHNQSIKKEFPAAFISQELVITEAKAADEVKQLSLEELIHFYKAPARTFLKHKFAIQVFNEVDVLPMREPFALESFIDTQIRQQVSPLSDGQLTAEGLCRAMGLLPHGNIGTSLFSQQAEIVQGFYQNYPELLVLDQRQQAFHLPLGEFTLVGKLSDLTISGCVKYQLGQYYAGDLLAIWLHHLVINSVAVDKMEGSETHIYQPNDTYRLTAIPDAKAILSQLLEAYWDGLQTPLYFFTKPAYKMYENGATAKLPAAKAAWENNFYGGESEKFEHQLLFAKQNVFNQQFFDLAAITFGRMAEARIDHNC